MGWETVGYSSDPVPDDPGVVAEQVQHLRNVASTIRTQLDRMPTDGNVDTLVWDSDAAAGFREVVKKLPKDLGTLKTRYERVASALDGFNTTLRACKADVAQGYADAQRATADAASASNGVRAMQDHATQAQSAAARANATAPPGTPPATPEPWTGPNYGSQLSSANAALRAAKAKVDGAVNRFRDASRTAASAVNDANHDDLKNDTSLWGSIKRGAHWVAEHVPLEAISGILSKISMVAGLLSLIPCLAPIFGPIALAAAGLTLLCDLVIQTNKAYEGTFSWGDFALTIGIDAVAVGAGFAAKWAGGAAKSAAATSRAATAEATAARGAAEVATTATTGARINVGVDRILVKLTAGGPIRRFVFGAVGQRAQASLARSQQSLAAAADAERSLKAVAAAKDSAAQAAAAAHHTAEVRAFVADGADKTAAVTGAANAVAHEHTGTSNPAVAFVRSTQEEVGSLVSWGHSGALAHAGSAGAEIVSQPIP